jgi:glycosyltransferase involved in cell wall biosynthesis
MMAHKNKIVFIITDFGSFENFISELCLFLVHQYHFDITVVCSQNKVIDFEDKFVYKNECIKFRFVEIPRGFNIFKQLNASHKINQIINEVNPDLVHAHFTTGIFTTILFKKVKVEIWGTFHGLGFVVTKGLKKVLFYFIEIFCFSRVDRIVVLNNEDFKKIPTRYLKKAVKQISLGLGCNLNIFDRTNYSDRYISELKKKFYSEKAFVLAFTGRYVSFKGFDIVARTFLCLVAAYPNQFKIMLIGGLDSIHATGLSKEEEERFFKHKDVINIGFTNKVSDYLIIADLFFLPSMKEGIPISITEALAMGIPVITFNARGCNELVVDNYNGYLVNPSRNNMRNVKELFQQIITLFNNSELRSSFAKNAIMGRGKLARENFINENVDWYKTKFNLNDR